MFVELFLSFFLFSSTNFIVFGKKTQFFRNSPKKNVFQIMRENKNYFFLWVLAKHNFGVDFFFLFFLLYRGFPISFNFFEIFEIFFFICLQLPSKDRRCSQQQRKACGKQTKSSSEQKKIVFNFWLFCLRIDDSHVCMCIYGDLATNIQILSKEFQIRYSFHLACCVCAHSRFSFEAIWSIDSATITHSYRQSWKKNHHQQRLKAKKKIFFLLIL